MVSKYLRKQNWTFVEVLKWSNGVSMIVSIGAWVHFESGTSDEAKHHVILCFISDASYASLLEGKRDDESFSTIYSGSNSINIKSLIVMRRPNREYMYTNKRTSGTWRVIVDGP